MAKKKGKRKWGKRFSASEKLEYHQNRYFYDDKSTKEQKNYSRHWLDGYHDKNASHNVESAKSDLKKRRQIEKEKAEAIKALKQDLKETRQVNNIVYGAYINGANSRLNKK